MSWLKTALTKTLVGAGAVLGAIANAKSPVKVDPPDPQDGTETGDLVPEQGGVEIVLHEGKR